MTVIIQLVNIYYSSKLNFTIGFHHDAEILIFALDFTVNVMESIAIDNEGPNSFSNGIKTTR